jgi:hypothetical protein
MSFCILSWVSDAKILLLQRWIAAPNWTGSFEAAKKKRIEDTGLWILQRAEYKAWLAQEIASPQSEATFAKKILLISGKSLPLFKMQFL